MARRIFNVFVVALLLALFIVPSMFLAKLSDEIVDLAERSVDAVFRKDWENGLEMAQQMNAILRLNKETMHLFLGHQIVEEIDNAMRSCMQLMQIEDQCQTLQELEKIITWARYLKTIETLNWHTLL